MISTNNPGTLNQIENHFLKMNETIYNEELEEDQILALPEEVFFQIFSYVPTCRRSSVALVCQKFYDLLCVLEKDEYPIELSFQQANIFEIIE